MTDLARPRLLLIDNHDSFTYNLVELLRQFELDFCVKPSHAVSLDEVDDYSHLLLSPGADTPDAYPNNFAILQKYHRQKSILGVCLGHQTLAQFFGATLYNLPSPRHGFDGQIRHTDTVLFTNLPAQFGVGLYHSWAVARTNFPDCLTITADDHEGVIMAFEHKTLPIFGVQFHPESYISEHGKALIGNWLAVK